MRRLGQVDFFYSNPSPLHHFPTVLLIISIETIGNYYHERRASEETPAALFPGRLQKNTEHGLTTVLSPEEWLNGKVVGLYFSAQWCPPCRQFTPILKKFYAEVGDDHFEIVFLSKDHSKEEYEEYIKEKHGHWCVILYDDPIIQKLQSQHDVSSIPTLVIVKRNGDEILKNAWATIQNAKNSPMELVMNWKEQCDAE